MKKPWHWEDAENATDSSTAKPEKPAAFSADRTNKTVVYQKPSLPTYGAYDPRKQTVEPKIKLEEKSTLRGYSKAELAKRAAEKRVALLKDKEWHRENRSKLKANPLEPYKAKKKKRKLNQSEVAAQEAARKIRLDLVSEETLIQKIQETTGDVQKVFEVELNLRKKKQRPQCAIAFNRSIKFYCGGIAQYVDHIKTRTARLHP